MGNSFTKVQVDTSQPFSLPLSGPLVTEGDQAAPAGPAFCKSVLSGPGLPFVLICSMIFPGTKIQADRPAVLSFFFFCQLPS